MPRPANNILVFLHGFMGEKEDWDPLIDHLPSHYRCICIDLLAHPEDCITAIAHTIIEPCTLVGYSMGGRIALSLADRFPTLVQHLILLSAHPPLPEGIEKEKRWQHDLKWIEMLESKPFPEFLEKWYEQPIFSTFLKNRQLYEKVVARRLKQNPLQLIQMMRTLSLGKQAALRTFFPSTLFLYGEEDLKFEAVSCTLPRFVKTKKIPHASHVILLENPRACAEAIEQFLEGAS